MAVVNGPSVASEFMQSKLTTIKADTTFSEAVTTMIRARVSGLPVVDDAGRYLGMFSEKCGLRVLHEHPELMSSASGNRPIAREAMITKLVLLDGEQDVFDGIVQLVNHHVSGAPVIDATDGFIGVFSEKTSMSVLTQAVFEGLQSAQVKHFANRDPRRIVDETTSIDEIVQTFVDTEFRRLPVIHNEHIVGQISRRDVLGHPEIYKRLTIADPAAIGGNDTVLTFADRTAKTIPPNLDLLSIIALFLNTPYRRLPVLDEDGFLVGQISRRDVLTCILGQCGDNQASHQSVALYLSALNADAPRFG